MIASIFFTVYMFSRLTIGVIILSLVFQKGHYKYLLLSLILAGVVFTFIASPFEIRHLTLTDPARLWQYEQAITLFTENPLIGHGYGYKLDDRQYIHNFILSSAVMLGTMGLVLSFLIFLNVCMKLYKFKHSTFIFLLIPIFGMLIGSSTEGLFTITSWIVLAITEVKYLNIIRRHEF